MKSTSSQCFGTTLLFVMGASIGLLIGAAGTDINLKHILLTSVVTIVFYTTQKFSLANIKVSKNS